MAGSEEQEQVKRGCALGAGMSFMVSVPLLVVTFAMLPQSSPPSEGPAILAAAFLWLGAVIVLAGASQPTLVRGRRIALAAPVIVISTWAGRWAGGRYERAVLDGCGYGTGSGSQSFCVAGATSRPTTVLSWTIVGIALGTVITIVALVARREVHDTSGVAGNAGHQRRAGGGDVG